MRSYLLLFQEFRHRRHFPVSKSCDLKEKKCKSHNNVRKFSTIIEKKCCAGNQQYSEIPICQSRSIDVFNLPILNSNQNSFPSPRSNTVILQHTPSPIIRATRFFKSIFAFSRDSKNLDFNTIFPGKENINNLNVIDLSRCGNYGVKCNPFPERN